MLAGFLAIALVFSDGFSGLFFFLNILLKAKGIANPEELVPPISEFEWDRLLCKSKNNIIYINVLSIGSAEDIIQNYLLLFFVVKLFGFSISIDGYFGFFLAYIDSQTKIRFEASNFSI